MGWQIDPRREGEEAQIGGYDGRGFYWGIADPQDGANETILVKFTGTAFAMAREALTERAALARDTRGKSEVEAVIGWPVPPNERSRSPQRG